MARHGLCGRPKDHPMKPFSFSILAAVAGLWLGATGAAHALNNISWVASFGSGSTCTRGTPCGDFPTAINATSPGGIVNCVDSGQYGVIFANKSITVDCTGTHATASNIQTSLSGITVIVRGVELTGASGSGFGISSVFHATLVIEDCTVRGFTFFGGATGNAVYFAPQGAGASKLVLTRVNIAANANSGVYVDSTQSSSPVHVMISDSVIVGNVGSGIVTNASSVTEIRLMMDGVRTAGNGIGVNSNGGLSNVIIGRSTVTENQVGFATAGGGRIFSYGNNFVNGNNNDNVNVSTLISQN